MVGIDSRLNSNQFYFQTMPCSRIGHIFKDLHPVDDSLFGFRIPYSNFLISEGTNWNKLAERNIKRAIAIWADQYRIIFDAYGPNDKEVDVSNII